jgi:hypothetical protein
MRQKFAESFLIALDFCVRRHHGALVVFLPQVVVDPQIPGNFFEGDLGRLDSFFHPLQKPGEFRGGNCFTPLAPFAPARGGEEFGDPSWFGWVGCFGNSNGCGFLGLTGFFVVGAHFFVVGRVFLSGIW